jgi:hypothetical protein
MSEKTACLAGPTAVLSQIWPPSCQHTTAHTALALLRPTACESRDGMWLVLIMPFVHVILCTARDCHVLAAFVCL